MNVQTLILDCPNCGEEIRNNIGLINMKENVFYVETVCQMSFECESCYLTTYTGDLEMTTE